MRVKMTHQNYYSLLTHEFTARKRIKNIYYILFVIIVMRAQKKLTDNEKN